LTSFKFKQVIAVRTDLGMSRGKAAVQVAHASVSASEEARKTHRSWWRAWMHEGQCKVTVKVKSESDLFYLEEKAKSLELPAAIVEDRGLTEIAPGTITCLAMGPGPSQLVDKVTGSLPLF
jgi:PTH2 family peptidyl-tRNA hydrolase